MNDTVLSSADRAEKLQGLGCKRRRVEDAERVQGEMRTLHRAAGLTAAPHRRNATPPLRFTAASRGTA